MEQVKEYTLVMSAAPKDLIAEVNQKISEGWRPIGGVFITQGPVSSSDIPGYVKTQTIQFQSMVR